MSIMFTYIRLHMHIKNPVTLYIITVAVVCAGILSSMPTKAFAEVFSYPLTGFSFTIPEGFVADTKSNQISLPSDLKSLRNAIAESESGLQAGSYYMLDEEDRVYTLSIHISKPLGAFDDLSALQFSQEWTEQLKRTVRDYKSMDSCMAKGANSTGACVIGWLGKDMTTECRQYLFSDELASYKLVFIYPASVSTSFVSQVETFLTTLYTGKPTLKWSVAMLGSVMALSLLILVALIVYRLKMRAASAVLFVLCVLLPSYADAKTGEYVRFEPPKGFELLDDDLLDEFHSKHGGIFDSRISGFVKYALVQTSEEDYPPPEDIRIILYPIISQNADGKPSSFEADYRAFGSIKDLTTESIEEMLARTTKFIFMRCFGKNDNGVAVSLLVLARKMSFGWFVCEVAAPKLTLETQFAMFIDSFLNAELLASSKLDELVVRPVNYTFLVGLVLLLIVVVFVVFVMMKGKRK